MIESELMATLLEIAQLQLATNRRREESELREHLASKMYGDFGVSATDLNIRFEGNELYCFRAFVEVDGLTFKMNSVTKFLWVKRPNRKKFEQEWVVVNRAADLITKGIISV